MDINISGNYRGILSGGKAVANRSSTTAPIDEPPFPRLFLNLCRLGAVVKRTYYLR